MGQTQSRASIPAGAGEVEKSTGGENAGHRAAYSQKKQQEEDLELLKKPKGAEVSEWACDFSIFRHKGNSARRICKGTFHSPGKKSPVLASLVRYFLPFALDKYTVLRWKVFRKKEKMLFFGECPFCHFVTGICPHGGGTAPIS